MHRNTIYDDIEIYNLNTKYQTNVKMNSYIVLPPQELEKGYVRPVRDSYLHGQCNTVTKMSLYIARTYARKPDFYKETFCYHCQKHFPIGLCGDFTWLNTLEKVGT